MEIDTISDITDYSQLLKKEFGSEILKMSQWPNMSDKERYNKLKSGARVISIRDYIPDKYSHLKFSDDMINGGVHVVNEIIEITQSMNDKFKLFRGDVIYYTEEFDPKHKPVFVWNGIIAIEITSDEFDTIPDEFDLLEFHPKYWLKTFWTEYIPFHYEKYLNQILENMKFVHFDARPRLIDPDTYIIETFVKQIPYKFYIVFDTKMSQKEISLNFVKWTIKTYIKNDVIYLQFDNEDENYFQGNTTFKNSGNNFVIFHIGRTAMKTIHSSVIEDLNDSETIKYEKIMAVECENCKERDKIEMMEYRKMSRYDITENKKIKLGMI